MRKRALSTAAFTVLAVAATVLAGDGIPMKCEAKPAKDPATGRVLKPCGYSPL